MEPVVFAVPAAADGLTSCFFPFTTLKETGQVCLPGIAQTFAYMKILGYRIVEITQPLEHHRFSY